MRLFSGFQRIARLLVLAFLGSLILTWLLEGWLNWRGLLATFLLLGLALFCLDALEKWCGHEDWCGRVALLAFLLRLVLGVALFLLLPVVGYDTPQQQAGYLYYDAFKRDAQAWDLAISSAPIASALGGTFSADQYGGMLALSAFIYRVLSPDVHRPWLILIVTALAGAVAVPFLWRALERSPFHKARHIAVGILAFYPEGVFLGASQMRDPIIIALGAILVWALISDESRRKRIGVTFLALAGMSLFSWLAAAVWFAVILIWALWTYWPRAKRVGSGTWIGAAIVLIGVVGLIVFGGWLQSVAAWDAYLTQRGSGWVQKLTSELPDFLGFPFIVAYGIFQPVLPAAIFDPSLPIWNVISTLRALGWYAILPLLFYGPWAAQRISDRGQRTLFVSLWLILLGWVVLSSLRAGGDLWDNPRYRTLLLPLLAFWVAWAWHTAREARDPWLTRWFMIEGIGLAFFTEWYVSRTYRILPRLSFWVMIGAIGASALLVLAFGWWRDKRGSLRGESS